MLNSGASSQYLPPDYLQPLPTTLDAKNSPLALLAQTCSSIGKDTPSKSIIPPLDKKDAGRPEKAQSADSNKHTPGKTKDCGRVSRDKPVSSSPEAKDLPYFVPISSSSRPDKPRIVSPKTPEGGKSSERLTITPTMITRPQSSTTSVKVSPGRTSPRSKPSDYPEKDSPRESPSLKKRRSVSPLPTNSSPSADLKYAHSLYGGLSGVPWNYPNMAFPPGFSAEALAASGLPMPLSGHNGLGLQSAHASVLAAHHAALKSSNSQLSNSLQYARMRNPSGATTLVPVCRDPYCTNCLSMQSSHQASACTSPGCVQCSHEKSLQSLSALGLPGAPSGLLPPFSTPNGLPPSAVGLSSLHSLSSLYAQNLISQQQQQGHPHVCNWVAGSEYCGKRFTSSEELLQHLRTHTAGGESALAAYGALGLPIPSSADMAGLHGYLGSSGSLSPGAIRRMYPTSLSPLGGSALHSSRFHPYKSALPSVPSGLPAPQSLSSLGPYYSPYNLYGARIGAAAVP